MLDKEEGLVILLTWKDACESQQKLKPDVERVGQKQSLIADFVKEND
jgi:hypothetical protein